MRLWNLPFVLLVAACGTDGSDADQQIDDERAAGEERGADLAGILESDLDGASDEVAIGKIASVVINLDLSEIDQAYLALLRSDDEAVDEFADAMVDDHMAHMDEQDAILAELALHPLDNAVARAIATEGGAVYEELSRARQGDFDRRYALTQVRMHAEALVLVEAAAPLAPDGTYRGFLVRTREAIEHHLEMSIDLAAR